eukprot:363683-Chlamydomonas_euryale.AAC.6
MFLWPRLGPQDVTWSYQSWRRAHCLQDRDGGPRHGHPLQDVLVSHLDVKNCHAQHSMSSAAATGHPFAAQLWVTSGAAADGCGNSTATPWPRGSLHGSPCTHPMPLHGHMAMKFGNGCQPGGKKSDFWHMKCSDALSEPPLPPQRV